MNNGTIRAIIVGVQDYKHANMNNLRFCNNDARRLFDALKLNHTYKAADVRLLTDEPESLTPSRSNILAMVAEVSNKCVEGDLILFFFAGHGIELDGSILLLTNDTRISALQDTSIELSKIQSIINGSKASVKFSILDCCRSNSGYRSIGDATITSRS